MGQFPTAYEYGRPTPVPSDNAGPAAAPQQSTIVAQTQIEQGAQQKQTATDIDETALHYDTLMAQDAINKLRERQSDLTYGPQNGFMNLKGGDVLKRTDGGEAMMAAFPARLQAAADDVGKNLFGRARELYLAKAPSLVEGYKLELLKHTMAQTEVYNKNVFAGTVKQAETDAVRFAGDPVGLQQVADRVGIAGRNFAKSQGLEAGPLVAELQSNVYRNAIQARIITGDNSAVAMFEQYKDKLDFKDRLALDASIKTMSIGANATAWVQGASAGPTTEQAKAGTKASMAFWTTPNEKGEKFSAPVAAGITAGFLRESQFFAGARNKGDGRDGSDSINIGQWNSARATAFQTFAASKGLDPNDVQTGLAYARAEIDGVIPYAISGLSPDFKQKLLNAPSEKAAADLMTRGYFRPKYTEGESAIRQQSASAILAQHTPADPLLAAVNAGTAVVPVTPSALASDGIVDARRLMIDAERQKVDLLTQARAQFSNNLPMLQQVQHQIEAQFSLRKAEVQLYKDQIYAGVQDWMTKGGPNGGPAVTVPPAHIFSQLTWEQQQSIERQVERNIAGKKTVTRQDVWYNIHQGLSSANANEREMWAAVPLMQYKEFLSDQDFQELAKLQATARKGDGKELTEVQTVTAMANAQLVLMGVDPTPKPGKAQTEPDSDAWKTATFYRVLQGELTMLEQQTGKKATPVEIQKVLDGMVKNIAVSKTWLGSTVKRPVAFLRIEDVPAGDRQQIIGEIRRQGGVPTDQRVLEFYRHRLATMPTQNAIPRDPMDQPPGVGVVQGRGQVTPGSRSGNGLARPARALPREIDNPPGPVVPGPQSRPAPGAEFTAEERAHMALRRGLGLER